MIPIIRTTYIEVVSAVLDSHINYPKLVNLKSCKEKRGTYLSASNPKSFRASSSAIITGNTSPWVSSNNTENCHLQQLSALSLPGGHEHSGQTPFSAGKVSLQRTQNALTKSTTFSGWKAFTRAWIFIFRGLEGVRFVVSIVAIVTHGWRGNSD